MLEVTFRLNNAVEEREQFADRIGDMLDGSYSEMNGVFTVTVYSFDDHGSKVDRAIKLARAVTELGADPEACDPDLVDLNEIAARVGKSHEAVRLWSTGKRRPEPPFPQPLYALSGGMRLWTWSSVNDWLAAVEPDLAEGVELLSRQERKTVDASLGARDPNVRAMIMQAITQRATAETLHVGLVSHVGASVRVVGMMSDQAFDWFGVSNEIVMLEDSDSVAPLHDVWEIRAPHGDLEESDDFTPGHGSRRSSLT